MIAKLLKRIAWQLDRFAEFGPTRPQHNLEGDRAIEWSWVVAHLPPTPSTILDFGCVQSALTGIAARKGHHVTAIDLREIEYFMPNVEFRRGDVNSLSLASCSFDVIMNCSTVEHVGLGGRYGSSEQPDGDLLAMERLRRLLKPTGQMILTVPVGNDALCAPLHRVYGPQRLPALLKHYAILAEEYWAKQDQQHWVLCSKDRAFQVVGSSVYYALGLFLLKPLVKDGNGGSGNALPG